MATTIRPTSFPIYVMLLRIVSPHVLTTVAFSIPIIPPPLAVQALLVEWKFGSPAVPKLGVAWHDRRWPARGNGRPRYASDRSILWSYDVSFTSGPGPLAC
jgi:hypothetical protein